MGSGEEEGAGGGGGRGAGPAVTPDRRGGNRVRLNRAARLLASAKGSKTVKKSPGAPIYEWEKRSARAASVSTGLDDEDDDLPMVMEEPVIEFQVCCVAGCACVLRGVCVCVCGRRSSACMAVSPCALVPVLLWLCDGLQTIVGGRVCAGWWVRGHRPPCLCAVSPTAFQVRLTEAEYKHLLLCRRRKVAEAKFM